MKLVIPSIHFDTLAPQIRSVAPYATLVQVDAEGQTDGPTDDAEILLRWFFTPAVLNDLVNRMPALRWLHIPRAGVDNSLVPAVLERDILVTNSAGVHAVPISEFVMMFVLDHAKQAGVLRRLQAERTWRMPDLRLGELPGKTMLIIGLGQIGQAIAARANAFGMRVWGSRRSGAPTPHVERTVGDGQWRELLTEADYVVIAAPLTPETRGMIGAAELAMMRPDAYLINIARGEIVDEAALIDSLRNGRIAGAGLDVFAKEPLPAESPLWELPNVFATPHISWSSPMIMHRTLGLFVDNLRRYVADEPLTNVVDKLAGY